MVAPYGPKANLTRVAPSISPFLKMTRKFLERISKWKRPKVIPGTEPLDGLEQHELLRGHTYLVKELKPKCSFQMFASLVKSKCSECEHSEAFPCESIGCEECTLPCPCKNCKRTRAQGLCFTMYSPGDVRFKYTLQTGKFLHC